MEPVVFFPQDVLGNQIDCTTAAAFILIHANFSSQIRENIVFREKSVANMRLKTCHWCIKYESGWHIASCRCTNLISCPRINCSTPLKGTFTHPSVKVYSLLFKSFSALPYHPMLCSWKELEQFRTHSFAFSKYFKNWEREIFFLNSLIFLQPWSLTRDIITGLLETECRIWVFKF